MNHLKNTSFRKFKETERAEGGGGERLMTCRGKSDEKRCGERALKKASEVFKKNSQD